MGEAFVTAPSGFLAQQGTGSLLDRKDEEQDRLTFPSTGAISPMEVPRVLAGCPHSVRDTNAVFRKCVENVNVCTENEGCEGD